MQSEACQKNSRDFVFDLLPMFAADKLDFKNQSYVVVRQQIIRSMTSSHHPYCNPYVENEVKGFIQHLALDEHLEAGTLKGYISQFCAAYGRFMGDTHPDAYSVTDFDYEELYQEYTNYLEKNGIQGIRPDGMIQVKGNMEWKKYPVKTIYLTAFSAFYKYVDSVIYPDDTDEYEKDIWDIRKLGIPYSTAVSRPRYTVNYTGISQDWLKAAAKEYNYYRIRNRTMSAVLDDMKALKLFSEFLKEKCPQCNALSELSRSDMEAYFAYVRQKGFGTTTYNRRISAIKTFFAIGNILSIPDFPAKPLITNDDFDKIVHLLPKYFTDTELKQMNAHISELPQQIGRMFFVLENCGMRLSDICTSPIMVDGKLCLSKNDKGEYIFTYYMPKCHRYNSVPISELVGFVIEDAIADSTKTYGADCKYIFAKDKDMPISTEMFVFHMNRMSKLNDLRKDNGTPLRIKGHTFRGTVATQYANCGIGMDVIRMMLGQRKIGVLQHYVTIHSATMVDCMRNIIDEDEYMIRNIGHVEATVVTESKETEFIPLPNGHCSKSAESGLCKHANACYACRMFRPSKSCLPIYEAQLREAEGNITVAELNGYERLLEINTDLKNNLTRIISKLKEET